MRKPLAFLFILIALLVPAVSLVHAQTICNGATSSNLCDPTAQFTGGQIGEFLKFIAITFGRIIGWTVIVMVMFSGFRMLLAQGNEEAVSKAKSSLQWSIMGFVLILLAYMIVYGTVLFLGGKTTFPDTAPTPGDLNPIASPDFGGLMQRMIQQFLILSGTIALLMIIISGIRYLTAGGNDEQVHSAKSGLTWSIIGLIIIALAYVIVVAVAKLSGATVT